MTYLIGMFIVLLISLTHLLLVNEHLQTHLRSG